MTTLRFIPCTIAVGLTCFLVAAQGQTGFSVVSREVSALVTASPNADVAAASLEVSVLTVTNPSHFCLASPPGLVAWWPGDGSGVDLAATNFATPHNGASFVPGIVAEAFSFDGVDDFVSVSDSPLWDFGLDDFSIALWVKFNRIKRSMFVHQQDGSGVGGFEFDLQVGGLVFARDNVHVAIIQPWFPRTNTWYHLAVIRYGGEYRLFVDGTQLGSPTLDSNPVNNVAGPLRIGNWASPQYDLDGFIDELSIFNRALSSNEIASIVAAGSAGMCKPTLPPSIVQQPTDLTLYAGQSGSFSVLASGDSPLRYQWRFNGSPVTGETNRVLAFSSPQSATAGPYDVVVNNALGAVTSRVATLTVRLDVPDLAVHQLSVPGEVGGGQVIPIVFTVTNRGFGAATLPWSNSVFLATNSEGGGARVLVSPPQPAALIVGDFLTVTQSVIVPTELSGAWYPGVTVNAGGTVFETNRANNTLLLTTPIIVSSPDLEVSLTAVASASLFGQSLNVTWVVRNRGTGRTFANWSDGLFLGPTSNQVSGAAATVTPLGSFASPRPLAPGESYTNSATIALPLDRSLPAGTYFVVVQADTANLQPEIDEANNLVSRSLNLSLPPRPDLAISSITSVTNGSPGQTVAVKWTVTNSGPATATGPWTETLRLVAAEASTLTNAAELQSVLGLAPILATLTFSNALPSFASITRTQLVALPVDGITGNLRWAVEVDARDDVFEEVETNNLALAQEALRIPRALALQLASLQISEEASVPLRATVTRNGSTADAVAVQLTLNDGGELSFAPSPTSVATTNILIPAGQSAIAFSLYAVRDRVVDGNEPVTLTASASGYDPARAVVTVLNADRPSLALTAATNAVVEGFSVVVTVSRDVVTSNAVTVALVSSNPGQLSPPDLITIPAGAASTNFTVLAVDDVNAEAPNTYSLTASATGFNDGFTSVSVLDNDVPHLTVSLSARTVSEGAGPQALSMTVTRNPVGAGALNIEPEASDPTLVVTPIRITIPAGQASRSFPLGVVNDTLVNGSRSVGLTAYALAAGSGAHLAAGSPDVLTVTDDDGPTLKIAAAQKLVAEGRDPATAVTIVRNTPPTNHLTVTLQVSRTNEAVYGAPAVRQSVVAGEVPGAATFTLTISNGQTSATVPLVTVNDGVNDGNQSVELTASAVDFNSATETVVVSDTDLPDLVVPGIVAPESATPQQRVAVTYRIANQGLSTANGSFLTRLYLSRDATVGDDVLVAQFRNTNTLAVGEQLIRTEQIDVPLAVGNYWVVVEADAEQSLPETLENNNTTIATTPIAVAADYAAWVQTDLTNAPAGTSVALSGRATNSLGAPVSGKTVNVHVLVRGTQRLLTAVTDSAGNFSTTFTPLPREAGRYEVFATHPGVSVVPAQDTFSLLGFRANPGSTSLTVIEGSSRTGAISLENLSDVALQDVLISVVSKPANLQVAATLPSPGATIPASGALSLSYTFAAPTADAYGTVQLRVTTAEGLSQDILFGVSVEPLRPRLVAEPASLASGMLVGGQAVVEFDLVNGGGRDSGPITVSLPSAPWMRLATTNPLPNLTPGQTNRVTLQLVPSRDLPLGPYTGSLAVNAANGNGLGVRFNFRAVSEAKGDLLVDVVDEFTYYAEGAPHLAGATVTVRDAVTRTNVASGITDTNGHFFVSGLAENYYEVEVTAEKHSESRSAHLVAGGSTNRIQSFLSRQSVNYRWSVTPVLFEDRYRVEVETTFEANVPAPVILIEPPVIDLAQILENETQINLRVSNHGLIAANEFRLKFTTHDLWSILPLIENVGAIPANSSVIIPVLIRRTGHMSLASRERLAPANDSGAGSCVIDGGGCWNITCGEFEVSRCSPVTCVNAASECASAPPPSPSPTPTPEPRPAPTPGQVLTPVFAHSPPTYSVTLPCCPEVAFSLASCLLGFIEGVDCVASLAQCAHCSEPFIPGMPPCDNYDTSLNCANAVYSCFPGEVADLGLGELAFCVLQMQKAFQDCREKNLDKTSAGDINANAVPRGEAIGNGSQDDISDLGALFDAAERVTAAHQLFFLIVGEAGEKASAFSIDAARAYLSLLKTAADEGSDSGRFVSSSEMVSMLGNRSLGAVYAQTTNAIERWNTTMRYLQIGVSNPGQLPAGANTNFIFSGLLRERLDAVSNAVFVARSHGFDSPGRELVSRALWVLQINGSASGSTPTAAEPALLSLASASGSSSGTSGICARVRLQLEQDAAVARDAFRATLELDNNGPSRLENVRVAVDIRDEAGRKVGDLFGERFEGASVLSAVDGTGILPGNSTGTAKWLLIPTVDAAPQVATRFLVGGTLSYRLDGTDVTVDMTPVPITVLPSPRLTLQYFHQRDVFSDDPFTPQVEPAVPYSLAVMVQNRGFGSAKNFRVTSAQPRIVDNEKGLLVDFRIVASEVAGSAVSPSLTVNFGDIDGGVTKIGRWLFTSSLQGLFTDYKATFEHIDGLGNPRLSLIDNVSIHEMNHLVQAGGTWEDGRPDFLVNDVADINDYPDTLYQSNGTTNAVTVMEQAVVLPTSPQPSPAFQSGAAGGAAFSLSAAMPAGWVYLRVPDPGTNQYRLTRVVRSDGVVISVGTNVWTTERTFIGLGRRPRNENILHLLDYNSTGQYTLFYEPGSGVIFSDTNAPVSAVTALAPVNRPYFQVGWSGRDEGLLGQPAAGIAYYDIFVSVNGGAFTNWLTRTELVSATYVGATGSRYAFYSVATDANGNRELAPGTPDAQTLVSLSNTPPSITVSNLVVVDEGAALDLPFAVEDPDTNQTVSVSLLSGAPPGVVLDIGARRLRWSTSEGNGPSTNVLTLVARDDDYVSLSATGRVTVVVNEVNAPPTLEAITNRTVNEGRLLTVLVVSSDADRPAQKLTYSLASGAPAGATIGANDGVFTWRPTEFQGGATNRLSIVVRDSGVPSLSATQSFLVRVRDTQGDFAVTLGSTNVFAGETNSVPLSLQSGTELRDISFVLGTRSDRLEGLSFASVAPEIGSSTLQPAGTNRALAQLTARAGEELLGAQLLARLNFVARSNEHSAVVPLQISEARATRPDGSLLARPKTVDGRVFVLGEEPILDALLETNGARTLVLYGRPDRAYTVETSTNLLNGGDWRLWQEVDLTQPWQVFPELQTSGQNIYFRATTWDGPRVRLSVHREGDRLVVEWPATAGSCVLLEATQLGAGAGWVPTAVTPQLNGANYRLSTPLQSNARFYRLRCVR